MYGTLLLSLGAVALASPQAPPPPELLTSTKSGVLPIAPTPFPGVETIEGAITYDGDPIPGFVGPGGSAIAQSGLPQATYTATLPQSSNFDENTGSLITGNIIGSTSPDGTGVTFTVNFTGFPSEAAYGPFVYHIHGLPVPADGNCTATMGHLDPTNRGELHACDVSAPQTCQAGDLAGKHGNITTQSFSASYTDPYLSTIPGSEYFFGDKSIVVHATNTTRLTCANFQLVGGSGSNSTNGTSGSPGSPGTPTSPTSPPQFTGAASKVMAASGLVGGAVALLAALL